VTSRSLLELARDRPPRTPEIHAQNDFYGHATSLKRYAGLRRSSPLKAVVEHGPNPIRGAVWPVDADAALPVVLCAGEERAEAFREATESKIAIPIGPMISYASDPGVTPAPGRLVAFPAHSTHHVRVSYDARGFARTLAGYRDRFSSVEVCLYWRDVLDGIDAVYRAEGFTCVTAGHIYDLEFLNRLRAIIGAAEAVVTNRYGTYVPYAVALDRPVWIVPQTMHSSSRDPAQDDFESAATHFAPAIQGIVDAFANETDSVTPEQRALLDPFIGFQLVRSPTEMRAILDDAAQRYIRRTPLWLRAKHAASRRVVRPLRTRWQWRTQRRRG
jgi:hypothetical protein